MVLSQAFGRSLQVFVDDNVVPTVDAFCSVARDHHCYMARNASTLHVAHGTPPEIVKMKVLQLCRRARAVPSL